MTNAIEIKMTRRGFEVTTGSRTSAFSKMEQALDFAQQRLQHALTLREISDRCE